MRKLARFAASPGGILSLGLLCAGAACSSSDADDAGSSGGGATFDAGVSSDGALAADSAPSTGTDAASGADAASDAVAPLRCSQLGEAPGTVVTVFPASAHPTAFDVGAGCTSVHVADDTGVLRACPYKGCDASNLATVPQAALATASTKSIGVALVGADVFVPRSFNGGPDAAVLSGSASLAPPPVSVFAAPAGATVMDTLAIGWGAGVVYRMTSLGNIKSYGLFYHLGATETMLGQVPGNVFFAKLNATEGYVFVSGGANAGPIVSLNKLSIQGGAVIKTAAVAPASFNGQYPLSDWIGRVHTLAALPEALLLYRTPAVGAPTLSTCAHADATPCLNEVALPASLVTDASGNQLDGRFHQAHGRLYATQNTAAGDVRIVYCTTASVASGTCAWTSFMSGFGAAGEGLIDHAVDVNHTPDTLNFAQDDDHLYLLRNHGGQAVVERIAK